ncbi:Opacity protein and related surface antigens [Legionella pneumophila]|uniref:outer membrane protein n=1 Tax=Legionella pneumophila TaxID=446 RepID=UPI0007709826|nr:outer membrane beta-barrel protein [Legionella pneumophila]HAT9531503.1 outer membrane beta-barrel protein [Legionella pneumophila subsp. pneumophila]CZH45555.1 Opacity protein and related surface antigens [Legionella pneumophila]CZI71306.1 Opacity protein and related surface antigens [Legionella pneumophila]HAU0766899.1 outer membrane beta-barrel protein [Legionella pneumophila]HAU0991273.1 outer membrane beta-barrel protein [Legionella pneumophila]
MCVLSNGITIHTISVFLYFLFFITPSVFFAGTPQGNLLPRQGIYVGASVSKDTGYYNFNRRDLTPPLSFVDQDITVLNGTGIGGEIYLGYKYPLLTRYSIALEGFYNRSSHSADFNLLDSNTFYTRQLTGSFKQKWQAGVAVRPGIYFIPQGLFYGRAGYLVSDVRLNGNIAQIGTAPFGSFSGNLNRSVNSEGLQLGLGMEIQVLPKLNIRLEWDWSKMEDYIFDNVIRDSLGNSYAIFRTSSNPTLEQIKLGVNWSFG